MRAIGEVLILLWVIVATPVLWALRSAYSQTTRPATVRVGSMALVAKLVLAIVVLLGLSDSAWADANAAIADVYFLLIAIAIACIGVVLALVALGLAMSPRTRRAALWVGSIASAIGVFVLWVALGQSDDARYYLYSHPHWLAVLSLPACISLIALNLGLRGAAPPSRTSKSVLVLLVSAPFLGIAVGAYEQKVLSTGPSSYQGIPLSEWVRRYVHADGVVLGTSDIRGQAGDAIRHIGPAALPLMLEWLDNLKSEDRLPAFGALGPETAALAIPELTRRINSPPLKPEERYSHDRPPYSSSQNRPKRERAMLALSYLGSDAVPAMRAVMSNPELSVLPAARPCIRNMGTNARPLLPLLVQNLQHPDPWVAVVAAYSLGELKNGPDLVIPALAQGLDHQSSEVRIAALRTLWSYAEIACPAVAPVMIKASNSHDPGVASEAVGYLGQLKCEPDLVVSGLAEALWAAWAAPGQTEQQWSPRMFSAVSGLERSGERARPALRRALRHPSEGVRKRALEALKGEPYLVIAALAEELDDPKFKDPKWALRSLDTFAELACPAVTPVMIKATHNRDASVASLALLRLGGLKCKPDLVMPALVEALWAPEPPAPADRWVRAHQGELRREGWFNAVRSLEQFGEPALPALRKALGHPDENVRMFAEKCIQNILAHKISPMVSR